MNLSAEHEELYAATLKFAQRLEKETPATRSEEEFPRDAWRECAEFGLLGMSMPAEYGGAGLDILSVIVAHEAFGRGCRDNGLAFSLAGQLFSCQMPILLHGSEDVRRHYLTALIKGDMIAAHAASEPDSGSDVNLVRTIAHKTDGGYLLNGTKTYSSLAPVSDCAVVLARMKDEQGSLTEFLVPKDRYRVSKKIDKIGLRNSPFGEIVLEDAFVPDDHVLGQSGSGLMTFMTTMEWERLGIVASCVGAMHRQLDECVKYARTRRQFGAPIGAFQAVSHRIVEMKRRLETSRLLLRSTAHLKQTKGRAALESALTKLHISESFVENSLDAVRVFGAYGVSVEGKIERDLRDSIPSLIYSGTSDIQRNTVARMLGLPTRAADDL